jgi:hypothetical protein
MKLLLTSLVMMTLTSCSQMSGRVNKGCDWISPLYIDKEDVLTQYTKRAILNHNQNWSDICMQGERV